MARTLLPVIETASHGDLKEIRDIIVSLLSRCGMSWSAAEYNHDFDTLCRADALRRGYPMEGPKSFAPFIHTGVIIATTAYAHLTSKPTQIFISHYTASLCYVDDMFHDNPSAMQRFGENFLTHQSQGDRVLDCFATLLSELPIHFSDVVSNLITPSTLNLITAMLLDNQTRIGTKVADPYDRPSVSRVISGATEIYSLFAFPPELSLSKFVCVFPELRLNLDFANEFLSLHKEEVVRDAEIYSSLLGSPYCSSKFEALRHMADAVVGSHKQVLEKLKWQRKALHAYKNFISGYFSFHIVIPNFSRI